jgi:hypothetical protein
LKVLQGNKKTAVAAVWGAGEDGCVRGKTAENWWTFYEIACQLPDSYIK